MNCTNCGTENRVGAKFCVECGTSFATACPNCGAVNLPGAKFCSECGTPLSAAPSTTPGAAAPTSGAARGSTPAAHSVAGASPDAERRLVSVLFADLVGFTPFAEERDAEDTREMLTRYFDIASDVISRHGGVVEKFIGDAVMAVWGTPVAHEDDAERSVRAGLELVDAIRVLGPGIQARAGVLTGEAAVTLGATNQGMVAGDMVNTAARLQAAAAPGTVLVGESTVRAAEAAIAFEPAGDQALKGKSAPVPAWRALRVVAERGGRNRSETLEAPFVGRDDELRLLKDLLHATARERRVRLVSVVGPAGIGKSRLAWEFSKYTDGLTESIFWHNGRSPSYGEGISFWALGEMVRSRAGLTEADNEDTTRRRIAETVATYVPDEAERRWIEPALLALLGYGAAMGPDQLFGAWRAFFERLAEESVVVMVFEDLHWADSGTVDFIEHLLDWSKGLPIMVVTLARPEFMERRSDWGAGKRNFVSMYIEPLPETSMRQLLAGLVPGLPESAVRTIVARADGMPLYAVETVRMLVADGQLIAGDGGYQPTGDLTELAVPETLTALIGARLDALEPTDRSLVQQAAVLGQSFTLPALLALTGIPQADVEPRLAALVRRETLTVEADPRSPELGQYAFVQSLIREVAYNTLAKRDRKAAHLAAARYFEGLGTEELAGALATHYLAAHANSPEGPEADAVAAQARIALRGAAERAAELGAFAQAATFYDQARQITTDQAEIAELLGRSGAAAEEAGESDLAETRLAEALDRRRKSGDEAAELRATTALAWCLIHHYKAEEALGLLHPAVSRWAGPDAELDVDRTTLLGQLSRALFFHEEHLKSIEVADRALPRAERLNAVSLVADLLITRGTALAQLGRSYEGSGAIRAGMELADANGLTAASLRARINLTATGHADPAGSYKLALSALETATRLGRHGYARVIRINAAEAAIELGDWDWAFDQWTSAAEAETDEWGRITAGWGLTSLVARRGEDVSDEFVTLEAWAKANGDPAILSSIQTLRADIAFADSRHSDACDASLEAARGSASDAPTTARFAGVYALLGGDVDRAQEALDIFTATGAHGRLLELDQQLLRTGIAAMAAPSGAELRSFREVLDGYRDRGLPYRLALGILVLLATRGGEEPEIAALTDEGYQIAQRLGAKPMIREFDRLRGARPRRTSSSGPTPKAAATPSTVRD